jgi:hypothetical protein
MGLAASQMFEFLLLQDAEQLRLKRQRKISNMESTESEAVVFLTATPVSLAGQWTPGFPRSGTIDFRG